MIETILNCPIQGLVYTEFSSETDTFYKIEPKEGYKIRVQSMENPDEEGNIDRFYAVQMSLCKPYDFELNEKGISAELI